MLAFPVAAESSELRVESALPWSWNPIRPIRAHQAFARLPVWRLGAVPGQLRSGEVGKPRATLVRKGQKGHKS